MRVPLHCAALLCLTKVANGKRSVRRLVDASEENAQRNLKKGERDDYYYGFARHDPKTLKGTPYLPSKFPSLSPPSPSSPAYPSAYSHEPTEYSSQPSSSSLPPRKKKSDTSKKSTTSQSKKSNQDEMGSKGTDASKGGGKGKGKGGKGKGGKGNGKGGKGKGKGGGSCSSPTADSITEAVPEVITRSPPSCCTYDGPIAVYVTHALPSVVTPSGFELFWDEIYTEIARTSSAEDVCFIMTGVDPTDSSKSLDDVLVETNTFVSQIPGVVSMMSTDPTDNVTLINEIRSISSTIALPSIGVFNTGYNNIVIESIVSGLGRLPYVGYLNDADYGTVAGKITLDLLNGVPAKPLCFNARLGVLEYTGERCAAYYNEITSDVIEPAFGVGCSVNSTVGEIFALLDNVNTVWAPLDCCSVVADAVDTAQTMGRTIVVGCQDADPSGGRIDFITQQPIPLEAYSAASWANFPVIQSKLGKDGRGEQYFPSLQSLVNTAIFNSIVL